MANPKKISALTAITPPLDGSEELPIVMGATTKKVTVDELNVLKYGKLLIPSADILTLFTDPVELVAAPGAGYAVIPDKIFFIPEYDSVPYATNTDMQIICHSANLALQISQVNALAFTGNNGKTFTELNAVTTPATDVQIIENKAILVQAIGGNPTAGDSDITMYFSYRIVKL